jgi:hypothetical protein
MILNEAAINDSISANDLIVAVAAEMFWAILCTYRHALSARHIDWHCNIFLFVDETGWGGVGWGGVGSILGGGRAEVGEWDVEAC